MSTLQQCPLSARLQAPVILSHHFMVCSFVLLYSSFPGWLVHCCPRSRTGARGQCIWLRLCGRVNKNYCSDWFVVFTQEVLLPGLGPPLKPATGRPYVLAFSLSGTVPAFTCDCLRFVCAFTRRRKFDLCVSTSSRTMLAFGNNVSFSSSECSTLAVCRR